MYGVREGDRLKEPALSFYHESYDQALLDIQHALVDQVSVDDRIKVRVVNDVVDVAVDVVIHPSGRNCQEVMVPVARFGSRLLHEYLQVELTKSCQGYT